MVRKDSAALCDRGHVCSAVWYTHCSGTIGFNSKGWLTKKKLL